MFSRWKKLPEKTQQYLLITLNYWAFTLTDGALRMLVTLYFYQLGYEPFAIAMLFIFYEVFGVVTNLVGGWLGARIGLNKTMNIGLVLQVVALSMLVVPHEFLSVAWVMLAQAFSGIAKDLNKMSAKSSIKFLVKEDNEHAQSPLFLWVARLTGSKNALKGLGYFLGGILLATFGFQQSILYMAITLLIIALGSIRYLSHSHGIMKYKPKFTEVFSKNASLNYLSAARMCLFASRDVWFVVALPVYLMSTLDWQHASVGAFLACWIIGYGLVQAKTPKILERIAHQKATGKQLAFWAIQLAIFMLLIVVGLYFGGDAEIILVIGLIVFGIIFAINSSAHSYAIISLARNESVSMDVGFYYMANALGRLVGTVCSGWIFQQYGLLHCLLVSAFLALLSAYFVRRI